MAVKIDHQTWHFLTGFIGAPKNILKELSTFNI